MKPGVLSRIFTNLFESLGRPTRTVIGRDDHGNIYYEESKRRGGRKAIDRGYIPGNTVTWQKLPVEWEAWLRGRRKTPPSEQEIKQNELGKEMVQQRIAQFGQKNAPSAVDGEAAECPTTKGKLPKITDSRLSKAGGSETQDKREFPKYKEFENIPGTKYDGHRGKDDKDNR